MKKISKVPYDAPAMVVRAITPPRVLCISGEKFSAKDGHYDDDSD